MLQELLHPARFVVFRVALHVVLHVVLQEMLHPTCFVVFPVVLRVRNCYLFTFRSVPVVPHAMLHVVLQELPHPLRFVVFPAVLHVVQQEPLHLSRFVQELLTLHVS